MSKKKKDNVQKEIVDAIPVKGSGRLLLAPRTGKTRIIIELIKRDKFESILWVTPSAELANGGIQEEFELWSAKRYLSKLTTCTYTSLSKIEGKYELVILDEEQHITENNVVPLLKGAIKYKSLISMTGTPTKHGDKITIYNQLNLKVLYKISINQAVDMKLLANYEVNIIEVPMSTLKNIEAGNKDNRFMTSEKANYEYLHKQARSAIIQDRKDKTFRILNRMRAVKTSKTKTEVAEYLMKKLEGRKLFFCGSINQAEQICEHTYHSKTDNVDLVNFISGDIDEIAMVNAGGTGFTYKKIDHLVVIQTDSDKNGATSQKISRSLLEQKDYKATIWIICLLGTQDEKWVESALNNFDKSKVKYIQYKNLINKSAVLEK